MRIYPQKAVKVHVAIDLEKEGGFWLRKEEWFGQLYFYFSGGESEFAGPPAARA